MPWLIETGLFQDEFTFTNVLRKRGIPFLLFGAKTDLDDIGSFFLNQAGKKVFYHGSFQGHAFVRWRNPSQNIITSNPDLFNCFVYYRHLQPFLHNRSYIIETRERIQEMMSDGALDFLHHENEGWFVRSNSSRKIFVGQRVYDPDILNIVSPDELLIVSKGEDLTGSREFRFIVSTEKILSASIYLDHTVHASDVCAPDGAHEVAEKIRQLYTPDDEVGLWTIDIMQRGCTFDLVEINSFSFADLYHCNCSGVLDYLEGKFNGNP